MAKRRKVGNQLALAVLSCLTRGPMHSYQIGRALRDHGDARSAARWASAALLSLSPLGLAVAGLVTFEAVFPHLIGFLLALRPLY